MTIKKTKRIAKAEIAALWIIDKHPEYTYAKVAEICGFSKQRINYILRKNNVPLRRNGLGSFVLQKVTRKHRHKRRVFSWKENYKFCIQCTTLISENGVSNRRFCSKKCRYEYLHIKIFCRTCNKPVVYRKYHIKKRLKKGQYSFYCSHKCYLSGQKYFRGKTELPKAELIRGDRI